MKQAGIAINNAEQVAFNILKNTSENARAELQRTIDAENAFIHLLEIKYEAKLNPKTGMLEVIKRNETDKS